MPCSRALLEAISEHSGARVADALVESSRRPWILLLDEQAVGVEIIPEGEPLGRFPFRSGVVRGEHPLLRAVCQGDELQVDEQNLLVLQAGRVTASLGARAFVWWHERIVQPDLLSRLVSLRFAPGRGDMRWLGGRGETSANALAEAQSLFRFVRRVCQEHLEHKTIAGFRLDSLSLRKKREVVVVLRSPRTTLHLVIALRHPGVQGYVAAGPFVVIVDRDHPIRRVEQDRAARRFAHLLASAQAQRVRNRGS